MIIITWNIRGLSRSNGKCKRGRMRQELHKYVIDGSPDILMLQEHRLRWGKIVEFGPPLQGN